MQTADDRRDVPELSTEWAKTRHRSWERLSRCMHPVVLGISHKTAPLELRERLALPCADAVALAGQLLDCETVTEAVVLSTCNRTEVYLLATEPAAARQAAAARLAERGGVSVAALVEASSAADGDAAIAHLFRVAASLDSLVVGEAQVLAQLKGAYEAARAAGCTGAVFNRLFRQALEVGKRVRSETAIGEHPVSVSSVAVDLARAELGGLDDRVVLVLGAGETGELTVKHLKAGGAGAVVVANRTLAAARALADRCDGRAACLAALDAELAGADIVISSTAAPGFLVDRDRLAAVMAARHRRPLFLIDIAVPRNLDPAIADLEDCCLYDIDDLRGVVAANRGEREREVAQAERIVGEEVARMSDWLAGLAVVPTVAALRGSIEQIRQAEIARLDCRLARLPEAHRAEVEQLTHGDRQQDPARAHGAPQGARRRARRLRLRRGPAAPVRPGATPHRPVSAARVAIGCARQHPSPSCRPRRWPPCCAPPTPALEVTIVKIATTGDRILDAPLSQIGDKGLFTKELEHALLEGRIDCAVHSAKDLPTTLPAGCVVGAFTARQDPRDVFVAGAAQAPAGLAALRAGARVGSSSLRRRSQLLALRPDLALLDLRGNVETRLRKVSEQGLDGTVLAAAGLAVRAERALLGALQGGCQIPIGAHAEPRDGAELVLRAFVGSLDGADTVRDSLAGPAADPEALGCALAERLRGAGAERLLAAVREASGLVPGNAR